MEKRIAVLPGDGIGPEVIGSAVKVLEVIARRFQHSFEFVQGSIGGAAVDSYGTPLPDETIALCEKSDAVLLGAVGGPKWDQNPAETRPEKGLLAIRKHFGLFANIRPVKAVPAILHRSPLKEDLVKEVDLVIVRELTGGLYFGEPSRKTHDAAVDTLVYTRVEIERIVRSAFDLARMRRKKVTSVDKANVLQSSRLWREVVEEVRVGYPDIEVEHQLVDSAAMKLITNPAAFDVIVTENMFGDILSDEASVITGSLGLLPSASVRTDGFGLYEPVHGSAPDVAGKGIANPAAAMLSAAMMLRQSFGMEEEAAAIELAIQTVYEEGHCTADLADSSVRPMTTEQWTARVAEEVDVQSVSNSIMFSYV